MCVCVWRVSCQATLTVGLIWMCESPVMASFTSNLEQQEMQEYLARLNQGLYFERVRPVSCRIRINFIIANN